MAEVYKKLAELLPGSTALADLYTVAASTSAVVRVTACNTTTTATTVRLSHSPAGAADANVQYLCFDVPVGANQTVVLAEGITMATTDKLRVKVANATTVTFAAHGMETS